MFVCLTKIVVIANILIVNTINIRGIKMTSTESVCVCWGWRHEINDYLTNSTLKEYDNAEFTYVSCKSEKQRVLFIYAVGHYLLLNLKVSMMMV